MLEDYILGGEGSKGIKPEGLDVGRFFYTDNPLEVYIKHITKEFKFSLNKLKIAVDCANGATSIAVPEVLSMFGADVISFNTDIKSGHINDNCGSTHPEVLKKIMLESKADIGFSYDGDGDRVIGCDRSGRILDGDVMMAFCAINMKKRGLLKNNSVVTTIMANYGFEKAMQKEGITVFKTKVGDRYVMEKMTETGSILGGEQSGHVIFNHFSHIGDGLVSTLIFLDYLNETQSDAGAIYDIMEHYPQLLKNIRVKDKALVMESRELDEKISQSHLKLAGEGKIVVRSSGTEPIVRVMVEASTLELAHEIQDELCSFILKLEK
jgi:phosphoglucosamine mutase